VKAFVKDNGNGGVSAYEIEVNFIPGHNPDLVLYDDLGLEKKRIDLTQYNSQEALHRLMADYGIQRKAGAGEPGRGHPSHPLHSVLQADPPAAIPDHIDPGFVHIDPGFVQEASPPHSEL